MGRIGSFLVGAADDDDDLLQRDKLAMSLMYLTRGQPVTYYGDEQGFVGWGGDKDARQDLFKTRVEQYAADRIIGGHPGARDRYDTDVPLYQHIAALTDLRADNPALATGIKIDPDLLPPDRPVSTPSPGSTGTPGLNISSRPTTPRRSNGFRCRRHRRALPSPRSSAVPARRPCRADRKLEMVVPARAVTVAQGRRPPCPKPLRLRQWRWRGAPAGRWAADRSHSDSRWGLQVTFAILKQVRTGASLGTDADNAAYGLYIDTRLAVGRQLRHRRCRSHARRADVVGR
ncbi:MAG: alpha-amylase family glycosyl hydrolase [Dermatophilaceae bacterium]